MCIIPNSACRSPPLILFPLLPPPLCLSPSIFLLCCFSSHLPGFLPFFKIFFYSPHLSLPPPPPLSLSSSDPYVKASLICDGRRLKKRKTSIKKNTLNPTYNEALVFDIPNENIESVSIIIAVMDYDW